MSSTICCRCGNTASGSIQTIPKPRDGYDSVYECGGKIITKYYCSKHLKEEILQGDLK